MPGGPGGIETTCTVTTRASPDSAAAPGRIRTVPTAMRLGSGTWSRFSSWICRQAAAEPSLRARENLVLVLINHNNFVTLR